MKFVWKEIYIKKKFADLDTWKKNILAEYETKHRVRFSFQIDNVYHELKFVPFLDWDSTDSILPDKVTLYDLRQYIDMMLDDDQGGRGKIDFIQLHTMSNVALIDIMEIVKYMIEDLGYKPNTDDGKIIGIKK